MPQLLHWVLKVGNLRKNLDFFQGLGMQVLRHEEFSSGCEAQCNGAYARPWSKTMVGFKSLSGEGNDEKDKFVFELTYNYGIQSYQQGNDFQCALIASGRASDVFQNMLAKGYQRDDSCFDPADMVVISPDGYRFKLIESDRNAERKVLGIVLNVHSLSKSVGYYVNVIKMTVFSHINGLARLGFIESPGIFLELSQSGVIDHANAYGRLAISVDGSKLQEQEHEIKDLDYKIHTPYVNLTTPGKADVQVVILQDVDDYEICLVGERGFFDLSQPFDGCDDINWQERIINGSQD